MNPIDSSTRTVSIDHYKVTKASESTSSFSDRITHEEPSTPTPGQSNLSDLLSDLDGLHKKMMTMSITEYLRATLTLEEKIYSQRLDLGEDLDKFGVNFEGRTYNIGGKVYSPGSWTIPIISGGQKYTLARPDDGSEGITQRKISIDVGV